MPPGLLVIVVWIGWCTLFAVAPIRRPRVLAMLSWGSGAFINELPFAAFTLLWVSVAVALASGDVDSTGGWVLVALATVEAVIILGVVLRRALPTRRVVGDALDDALGSGWPEAVDPATRADVTRGAPIGPVLLAPLPVRGRGLERSRNLRYGPVPGRANLLDVIRLDVIRLDVIRSRATTGPPPVFVHLHGGGFRHGAKSREARPLLDRLARRGWTCISANYRLVPQSRFPDPLVDVKRLLAWIREHAGELGVDAGLVIVAGSSAGAHLAATAALTPDDPRFQPGFERADTSVSAAVCLYGYYGPLDAPAGLPSSPFDYVSDAAPPFFVAHGDHDTYTSVDGARALVEELRARSCNPVVYAELPGGQHSFDVYHSIRYEAVVDGIEAFAAWVRARGVSVR